MLEDGKLIDMDIADTIIERPHGCLLYTSDAADE